MLAVALAGLGVYAPAMIARASTGPMEPVDFLTAPQQGWRFLLTAASQIKGARAGSPSAAREIAVRRFTGSSVQPTRVDLLWVPDRRVPLLRGGGRRVAAAKASLVWMVTGRTRPRGPLRTVGLIDFQTGALTYDVRTVR